MGVAALILVTSATIASVYTTAIFMILAGGADCHGAQRQDLGPVLSFDRRGASLYCRCILCSCSAFGGGRFFHVAARGRNDKHGCGSGFPRCAS